jgi:hypothetical protein
MVVGIEQHLVRLGQIGPQMKRPTVTELGVCDLQFGLTLADDEPVFAPVELKGFARGKGEWHVGAAACLLGAFAFPLPPIPGEGGYAIVRSIEAQRDQVPVQLL